MSQVRFEIDSDDVYHVIGELNMASVPSLLKEMTPLFNTGRDAFVIDLNQVSRSDSAGLALILEWLRLANKNNIQLSLRNLPGQMQAIIRVSGLEDLITA